jgi:hypothetical protein
MEKDSILNRDKLWTKIRKYIYYIIFLLSLLIILLFYLVVLNQQLIMKVSGNI